MAVREKQPVEPKREPADDHVARMRRLAAQRPNDGRCIDGRATGTFAPR